MSFFFSSRLGTGSEATTSSAKGGSVTTVIKSKWYGKARAMPPSISTSNVLSDSLAPLSAPTSLLARDMARTTLRSPSSSGSRDRIPSPLSAPPLDRHRDAASTLPLPSTSPKAENTTLTLAARLEELELSNSEGLLDDEGYRILRQNLFKSYSNPASATLPSEKPPVRISTSSSRPQDLKPPNARTPKSSNFHISTARAESIRSPSRSTVSTVMSNVFKRPSPRLGRPSTSDNSELTSDNVSVFSGVSRASASIHRALTSSKSSGSLGSEYSQSQQDLQSLSSRQTGLSAVTGGSRGSRSTRNPPSAFNLRRTTVDVEDDDDDAHRQSSSELRTEISQVEAEFKRIMDNYHGAELGFLSNLPQGASTLTSSRPLSGLSQATVTESTWTLVSNAQPPIDDSSGKGLTSLVTTLVTPTKGTRTSTFFGSLRRKASNSSSYKPSTPTHTRATSKAGSPQLPTIHSASNLQSSPASSSMFSGTQVRSTPNLLLRPSTAATVRPRPSDVSAHDRLSSAALFQPFGNSPDTADGDGSGSGGVVGVEDGPGVRRTEQQLERIRMSKEDAEKRYAGRLEFLKTKLKTAEIHERLLKK